MQSCCFANLNLLLFYGSRCRRRRRYSSSVILYLGHPSQFLREKPWGRVWKTHCSRYWIIKLYTLCKTQDLENHTLFSQPRSQGFSHFQWEKPSERGCCSVALTLLGQIRECRPPPPPSNTCTCTWYLTPILYLIGFSGSEIFLRDMRRSYLSRLCHLRTQRTHVCRSKGSCEEIPLHNRSSARQDKAQDSSVARGCWGSAWRDAWS